MLLKRLAVCASVLGAYAVNLPVAGIAGADPQDPHKPDITHDYCPGGQWGYGSLGVCDGDKYPDGSYWHQWMKTYFGGPKFHYTASAATNLSRRRLHQAAARGRSRPLRPTHLRGESGRRRSEGMTRAT